MHSFNFGPLVGAFSSLMRWPLDWACCALARQSVAHQKLSMWVERPSPGAAADFTVALCDWRASAAAAPFDLVRSVYAAGVQCGLIECSMLASTVFEHRLMILERLAFGPFARTV